MTQKSFIPPKRVLMGPGPSDVNIRVLEAMARPTIGHLDPKFIELMDEIKDLLQYAFQTENEVTFPVSGPGSLGMETALVNLVEPGNKVVVCQNGFFGGRMRNIVERCGGKVIPVEDEWGKAIDPGKLENTLKSNPDAKIVAFVHAETSTGVLSNAQLLAEIARKYDCLSVADTVTSLCGVPVKLDEWGIDVAYSGSQKCLSGPPGLSPISFSDRAVEHIKNRKTPIQSLFMDVPFISGYWGSGSKRAYHHTAPINSLYGLHEGLLLLKEEGIENAWKRHQQNHLALCAGLETFGLELVVEEKERIPQLNAVAVPRGVDEAKVRQRLLNDFNLEIGAGLGNMAGKIWRIGLMGYSSKPENIYHCLNSLEKVLADSKMKIEPGKAAEVAQKNLG